MRRPAKADPKNPLAVIPYSAGYALADGSSQTLINGATAITSDSGSVSVTSEATTSAVVQAFTASNATFGDADQGKRSVAPRLFSLPSPSG